MKFAMGAWAFVLGYALVYTGVGYFITPNPTGNTPAPSLASVLGITALQGKPTTTGATATTSTAPATGTASTLA